MIIRVYNKLCQIGLMAYYRSLFNYIGKGTIIRKLLVVNNPDRITVGENVYIGKLCRVEAVVNYNDKKFHPKIVFKKGVSIQQFLHLTCANSIVIGEDTAIAASVTITDIHHPYKDVSLPIEKQNIEVGEVFIGNGSKIYNNTVILPNTHIGDHVTIGANSVVSGTIPDYCVAVGAPARIIKRYCFETKQWKKTDKEGNFTA